MSRHRRHSSLDSHTTINTPSIVANFTLQVTPSMQAGLGNTQTKITAHAHTSPLATEVTLSSSPLSPTRLEEGMDDIDRNPDMKRMVSSVVNSPVDTSISSESSPSLQDFNGFGLGIPGCLQAQQNSARQAMFTPSTRSLLGDIVHHKSDPKLTMGTRAAFGNFRKRCFSAATRPNTFVTPEVMVSLPSPTQDPPAQIFQSSPTPPMMQPTGFLTPPDSPENKADSPSLSPKELTRHRRSASVGALPSLDQIREWSVKRFLASTDLPQQPQSVLGTTRSAVNATQPPPGLGYPPRDTLFSPPIVQIQDATPHRLGMKKDRAAALRQALQRALTSTPSSQQVTSLPSTPTKKYAFEHNNTTGASHHDRSHRGQQMVSVLERRKSLSLVSN